MRRAEAKVTSVIGRRLIAKSHITFKDILRGGAPVQETET